MADFSSTGFQNVLPDPNNTIDYAGSPGTNTGYAGGPGYSSVQLTSEQKTLRDRTNSGRILARATLHLLSAPAVIFDGPAGAELLPPP